MNHSFKIILLFTALLSFSKIQQSQAQPSALSSLQKELSTAANDTVRGYYYRKLLWASYLQPALFVHYYIEGSQMPTNEWSMKESYLPVPNMQDSIEGILREFQAAKKQYHQSGDLPREIAVCEGLSLFLEDAKERQAMTYEEETLLLKMPESPLKKYFQSNLSTNKIFIIGQSGDPRVAIRNLLLLKEENKGHSTSLMDAYIDGLLGSLYIPIAFNDSAVFYTEKMLEYARNHGFRNEVLLMLSEPLIRLTGAIGQLDKCKYYSLYCEKGLPEVRYMKSLTAQIELSVSLYYMNIDLQKEKSKNYLDSAKVLIDGFSDKNLSRPSLMLTYYRFYAEWAKTFGDYKAACDLIEKCSFLNDSLISVKDLKEYDELQIQYEVAKKDQETALAEQKMKIQAIWFYVTIVFLLMLAAGIFIYIRNKNKIKNLESIINVRNSISANLHDDVGSSLSSITIISDMVRSLLKTNPDKAEELLQKISETSVEVMSSMKDIVWSINPENDNADNLINKMREFSGDILENRKIAMVFNDQTNCQADIDFRLRQDVYMIFKEAINNAAKSSNATLIEINLFKKDGHFVFEINDNGTGFDEAEITPGNGIINMRRRAEKIGASLKIESAKGSGTKITFTL